MDIFLLVMFGVPVVLLGIAAAVYAVLYRKFASRIEKSWKRAAFLFGCSAVLSPGLLIGLGHGIPPPVPAGLAVLVMLMRPDRFDQYFQGIGFNLISWAITLAVFYCVGYLQRRRAAALRN